MVELAQIRDRFFHSRPGLAQKRGILSPGKDVVTVDHQDELGVEVLPVVGILPAGLIDGNEGIAFGHAKVVGHCAFLFPHV